MKFIKMEHGSRHSVNQNVCVYKPTAQGSLRIGLAISLFKEIKGTGDRIQLYYGDEDETVLLIKKCETGVRLNKVSLRYYFVCPASWSKRNVGKVKYGECKWELGADGLIIYLPKEDGVK